MYTRWMEKDVLPEKMPIMVKCLWHYEGPHWTSSESHKKLSKIWPYIVQGQTSCHKLLRCDIRCVCQIPPTSGLKEGVDRNTPKVVGNGQR